ncbi:hypothetical protein HYQ44_001897 [Verticillium longisporum]|nr:hypothetical protein HYQ44_001897 [Verticillium longisporum]
MENLKLLAIQCASSFVRSNGCAHHLLLLLLLGLLLELKGLKLLPARGEGGGTLHHLGESALRLENGTGKAAAGLSGVGGTGHLDGHDAAKGTGAGGVLPADEADLLLAGNGAGASLLSAPGGQSVEFDDLMNVQASFEQVLERSADGVSLPMEMKRSESSIRDLRTMVRYSELPARDELVFHFDEYIATARQTASDLQKFNTHVGSAVDSVISINHWTSRYLDALDASTAAADADSAGTGLAVWTSWLFAPFQPATVPFDERALLDKYIEHTALVSDRIAGLIVEAQAVLRLLTRAEDHLSLIYDVVTRSHRSVRDSRDDVLWTLWSLVGANNRRISDLNGQLRLLRAVDTQRSQAVSQVSALVVELEKIEAGLGDLRDRVAEPGLARSAIGPGPGLGDRGAIPLSVHVETIDRGVDRLEEARRRIRDAEDDKVREALARGGVKDEARAIDA